MKRIFSILTLLLLVNLSYGQQIPQPKDFFGFEPGADRQLFNYEQLVDYLKIVEANSPRVKLFVIGQSMMGRPIYMVVISSEENIKNLDHLKEINKQLALNPNLTEQQVNQYAKEGKVFVLMTLSMHSTEVGPSQALPKIVYELATTQEPEMLEILDKVVYMAVASHNPDGMDMVVEHYNKYKGTPYEGSSLPGVYHKYVGHDNNRDFVILTQSETKAINRLFSKDWFPQVMVEKHQMGYTGPRLFVPPKHDPIAENIDEELWAWDGVFGLNMLRDLTEQGYKGIAFNYLFDDYWPGSTETAHWKNIIAMLTEVASVKIATPIYIEPNELSVSGKGLAEYEKSAKMPAPWNGGWWRLSDIVNYEIATTYSILKTAATYKEDILKLRNRLCKKEVQKGKEQPPYYYIFPINSNAPQQYQNDPSELVHLVNLLQEHGVEVYQLTQTHIYSDLGILPEGSIIIPLAQPFRAFIKEVLEKQKFPVRHYTKNGPMIKPYDITSWSLPLHFGLNYYEINNPTYKFEYKKISNNWTLRTNQNKTDFQYIFLPAEWNISYKAVFKLLTLGKEVYRTTKPFTHQGFEYQPGGFIIAKSDFEYIDSILTVEPIYLSTKPSIAAYKLTLPKIALVETYMHDMDAGWTRYIFDIYNIPYKVLRPSDFKKENLEQYDVIVFPDNPKSILIKGKYGSENRYYIPFYPPEYTKGMGKEGLENLLKFIDNGGVVIAWGRASQLFTGTLTIGKKENKQEFSLPYSDISKELRNKGLFVPGTLVKVILNKNPITWGLPDEIGVFYRSRAVYKTTIPRYDTDRRIIGYFPKEEKEIVLSGYGDKVELIAYKPATIWITKNKGQIILFSFNPQFRASTPGTFKLLFNSLLITPQLQKQAFGY